MGEADALETFPFRLRLVGFPMSAALAHHTERDPTPTVAVATATAGVLADVERALPRDRFRPPAQLTNTDQLVAYVRASPPDVLILDVALPGGGLGACARVARLDKHVPIVALSDTDDDEVLFGVVEAGAAGLLLLPFTVRQLARVIDVVLAGDDAFPRDLTTRAVRAMISAHLRLDWLRSFEAAGLSVRQLQVLDLLAAGLSTAEIADRLFVSKITVRTHVSAIVAKLHVATRAEAITLAQSVRRNQRVDL